jgi:trimeric autotransporter adhesin
LATQQSKLVLIAQELETVFPAMVDETPDCDAEGNDLGTTTKSVKYSVFVPMLIKAIQELKAENDALKARLDAANL